MIKQNCYLLKNQLLTKIKNDGGRFFRLTILLCLFLDLLLLHLFSPLTLGTISAEESTGLKDFIRGMEVDFEAPELLTLSESYFMVDVELTKIRPRPLFFSGTISSSRSIKTKNILKIKIIQTKPPMIAFLSMFSLSSNKFVYYRQTAELTNILLWNPGEKLPDNTIIISYIVSFKVISDCFEVVSSKTEIVPFPFIRSLGIGMHQTIPQVKFYTTQRFKF